MRSPRSETLDRVAPALLMQKGTSERQTRDYLRHGTTLFVALDTASGKLAGFCGPRHRHHEFLALLKQVRQQSLNKPASVIGSLEDPTGGRLHILWVQACWAPHPIRIVNRQSSRSMRGVGPACWPGKAAIRPSGNLRGDSAGRPRKLLLKTVIGAPRRGDDVHHCRLVVGAYPLFSLFPGMAVGAAGARTGGVNRFPPVGLILFSVGTGGGGAIGVGDSAVVVVVVVGDRVVDGAFEPLPLQLAIDAANAARTTAPATMRVRRTGSRVSMMKYPIGSAW
jgi:hypothetical protein